MCYKDMIVLLRARARKFSWLPLKPVVNQEMISMESDTLRGTQYNSKSTFLLGVQNLTPNDFLYV